MCFALFQNKNKLGGREVLEDFEETPGIFRFLFLLMEIPDKTKLQTLKLHKNVLDPMEILRPKTKTPKNFTVFS